MPSQPEQLQQWTVTIDAAGQLRDDPVDGDAVESLIDHLRDYSASVSHLPRRYTTRLTVFADGALEAAGEAVEVWRKAVVAAGLPEWPISRLETASSTS